MNIGIVDQDSFIASPDDLLLVTGATGFIGLRLVKNLLNRGFRNVRCFVRSSNKMSKLQALVGQDRDDIRLEIITGNLLSRDDCAAAVEGVSVVFHLAAGRGEKSFPDAFLNSVITTRNLLEACAAQSSLRRFVSISSFATYTNQKKPQRGLLDETCPVEMHSESRGDAYTFAKVKQDEIVIEYGKNQQIPYVIVRPGYVYGPGNEAITGRVGVGSFGIFLHLGGSNTLPLTYVDNCADAIALAGLRAGVDGEVFNVVDDDLPSSRKFLRLYKRNVNYFRSLYLPHWSSYLLCRLWEGYSKWSGGQLPPVFNRRVWYTYWKKTRYSNRKLKTLLGWKPEVPSTEGLTRYFTACRDLQQNA